MAALGAAMPATRLRAPAARAPGRARLAVRAVASPPAPSSVVWTPDSWRSKKAIQMPDYADPKALSDSVAELRRSPPLIFAGEVRIRRPPRRRRRRGSGRRCARGLQPTHFSRCSAAARRAATLPLVALALPPRGGLGRASAGGGAGRAWVLPPRAEQLTVAPRLPRATAWSLQVRELRKSLAKVANGEAFLLQVRPAREARRARPRHDAPKRQAQPP